MATKETDRPVNLIHSDGLSRLLCVCVLRRSVACSFFHSHHTYRFQSDTLLNIVPLSSFSKVRRWVDIYFEATCPNGTEYVRSSKAKMIHTKPASDKENGTPKFSKHVPHWNYLTTKLPSLLPTTVNDASLGGQSIHRSTPAHS